MVIDFLEGAGAAVLTGCVAWSSYLVARRLLAGASVAVRWSGALLFAGWSLVALFWLLSSVRGFTLPVVLLLWLALAALATRAWAGGATDRRELRADALQAVTIWRELDPLRRVLAAAVATVASVRLLRGLAEPPLGWDALTYHLVKAGRWVQEAGFVPFRAPGAWGYYDYFAEAGDVLWAWAMLPLRSDALIVPAGALVWLGALVGTYAAGRELGAGRNGAASAALAVGAMPAALAYLTSAYVDNVTLAAYALGSVFVVRLARGRPLREAPLAVAGLGLALGTKLLAAPLLGLGAIVVLVRVARSGESLRRRAGVLALCLVAALPGLPSYARAWLDHGSPFYPFPLEVAGHVISAGNEESRVINAGILAHPPSRVSAADVRRYLLYRQTGSGSFLGFGLGLPFLALLALGSAPRWRGRALAAGYLTACAAALLALYFSGAMVGARTTFMVTTSARYLIPGVTALAALASLVDGRIVRLLWGAAVLGSLVLALPRSWVPLEAGPLSAAFAVVALVAAGLAVAGRLDSWGRRWRGLGAAVAVSGVAAAGLESARELYRYPVYRAAADPADLVFHMHPLNPFYAQAWPLWQELDELGPQRLAVTAGFHGLGHNWYLYPLLGGGLENRLVYVPPTRDGSLIDYREHDRLARSANLRCWLARLVEARVDFVASLTPRATVEDAWMRGLPELFEPELTTPGGLHALFRFNRDALTGAPTDDSCASTPGGGSGGAAAPRE